MVKEIINLGLTAQETGGRDPEAVMKDLLLLELRYNIGIDRERMLVSCYASDSNASQAVWETAGRRFPLTFYFDIESPGGKAVMELHGSLSESDRGDIDLFPARVGCRMSLYIRRERADLIARFWSVMFPPDIKVDASQARSGRVRLEHCTSRVPDELILQATKRFKASDLDFRPDGSVYISGAMLRQLQREHEEDALRSHGRKTRPDEISLSR